MARIKFGSIATEIRGSIGGTTFQKTAYGFSVKNKANMARLQSPLQNEKHRLVTLISQRWLQLTQYQRDHWVGFALAHPVPSKHNIDAVLDGYTYFLKYNLIRCNSNAAPMDDPTDGSLALPPVAPFVTNAANILSWSCGTPAVYLEWAFNCYLSPPQTATQGYNASKTRYMGQGNISNTNVDVTNRYKSAFGQLPAVGSIVFGELQPWGLYVPVIPESQYFILHVV